MIIVWTHYTMISFFVTTFYLYSAFNNNTFDISQYPSLYIGVGNREGGMAASSGPDSVKMGVIWGDVGVVKKFRLATHITLYSTPTTCSIFLCLICYTLSYCLANSRIISADLLLLTIKLERVWWLWAKRLVQSVTTHRGICMSQSDRSFSPVIIWLTDHRVHWLHAILYS